MPLWGLTDDQSSRPSFIKGATLSNVIFEDNAAVYADGDQPITDPNGVPGWYYKNSEGKTKINWYFIDGQTTEINLGDLNIYTKVKVYSNISMPIIGIYTIPDGVNDAASWYKSKVVYSLGGGQVSNGEVCLFYIGSLPPASVEPNLRRVQLVKSSSSTVGTQDPTERVLTASFGSNSAAPRNGFEMTLDFISTYISGSETRIHFRIAEEYAASSGSGGAQNILLVDIEEASSEAARQRGLTTPGWNTYTTYTDTNGVVRHKPECLVAFAKTKAEAGDSTSDDDLVG